MSTYFVCREIDGQFSRIGEDSTLEEALKLYQTTRVGPGGAPVSVRENVEGGSAPTAYKKFSDPKPSVPGKRNKWQNQ